MLPSLPARRVSITGPENRHATCERIALEKRRELCDYGRMKPEVFGVRAAGPSGDLPEERQALIASQASTLAALLSRMQIAAATIPERG